MKKFLSITLAAAMLLSLLVGCGNDANKGGQGSSASGQGPENQGSSGKTSLIVGTSKEPVNFYPISTEYAINMSDAPVNFNVYEAPLKLNPDGTYSPGLAESWTIEDGGTSYVLKIRQGVTFHDGNPLTVEDVVWSMEQHAQDPNGKSLLINFESVEAVDESTVVIHLSAPFAPFLGALASNAALILEKDLAEKIGEEAYSAAPVGTGPYTFVSRQSGDNVKLAAYENYWGGAPAIKDITIKVLTDVNSQVLSLENGDIDALLDAPIDQLLRLNESSPVKYTTTRASQLTYLTLNCKKGPAADINFRRAVQYGINKEDVVIGTYEGAVNVLDTPLSPILTAYPEEGSYQVIPYDPEQAKAYLAESNYAGEEFTIIVPSGTKEETAAQIIQGQLIAIGINCVVNAVDNATYMGTIFQDPSGNWGSNIRANGNSSIDADGSMNTPFGRTGRALMSAFAPHNGSDEMEEVIAKGRAETDEAARAKLYARGCDIVAEEVWAIPLYDGLSIVAYNGGLQGAEPRPLAGIFYFNEWSF